MKTRRWVATVHYRSEKVDSGIITVEHDLSEIYDLHDLVENGPHWDTIVKIIIERVDHNKSANLTVEEAERL